MGYTTIEMKADKWYQVAFPFVQLDDTETVSISEAFNSGFVDGDTAMVLDSQTGLYQNQAFWVSQADEGKGAWCDLPIPAIAKPVDVQLAPGQAVFIHKSATSDVIVSGKVKATEAQFGTQEGNAWNQVGVVWPESKDVNDLKWTGVQTGDTLCVLDVESGLYGQQLFWVPTANEGQGAWCDLPIPALAKPVSLTLAPGQAVFINKVSAGIGAVVAQ